MAVMPDREALERLSHADGITASMIGRVGLNEWTVNNAMALAFYALKFDDPERTLGSRLDFTEKLVKVYGRRMPEWCSLDALVNFEGIDPGDEWDRLFMDSQDYLQMVIDMHGKEFGGMTDEAILEIGRFLCFQLASACMGYDSARKAFGDSARLARATIAYAVDRCSYETS